MSQKRRPQRQLQLITLLRFTGTIGELARAAGISRRGLYHLFERGHARPETLARVAAQLQIPPSDLAAILKRGADV